MPARSRTTAWCGSRTSTLRRAKAEVLGASCIVDVGCGNGEKLAALHPRFDRDSSFGPSIGAHRIRSSAAADPRGRRRRRRPCSATCAGRRECGPSGSRTAWSPARRGSGSTGYPSNSAPGPVACSEGGSPRSFPVFTKKASGFWPCATASGNRCTYHDVSKSGPGERPAAAPWTR